MRVRLAVGFVGVVVLGVSVIGQRGKHLNAMVDLLSAKKAVFGLGLPSAGGGGGGGGNRGGAPGTTGTGGAGAAGSAAAPTTPPPPPAPVKTPLELAKDALAHPEGDYFFTGSMQGGVDRGLPTLMTMQDALVEAGAIAKKPYPRLLVPINVKTPNISRPDSPADPAKYIPNISRQLNAGVAIISFVEVDTAEELRQGIAAMRFKSKGGTRPDDVGNAPKYWGLSEKDYRKKADVWPLNKDGELIAWAIVETKEGLANVREIAQVKGLGVLVPGAGTLGGVFSTTNAEGRRVRDDAAWEAALQQVLAACKEFKVPCGYPVSEADIETRMKQGFSVAILQSFGDPAFRAVAKGRQISGRDQEKK
jgi:4-hydroxy-2-oxoheptanedioate aldolase